MWIWSLRNFSFIVLNQPITEMHSHLVICKPPWWPTSLSFFLKFHGKVVPCYLVFLCSKEVPARVQMMEEIKLWFSLFEQGQSLKAFVSIFALNHPIENLGSPVLPDDPMNMNGVQGGSGFRTHGLLVFFRKLKCYKACVKSFAFLCQNLTEIR